MGERARDSEGLRGGDEGLALERAADQIDDVLGELGEIPEGLMLDSSSTPQNSISRSSIELIHQ
jgi:hypothetical protein